MAREFQDKDLSPEEIVINKEIASQIQCSKSFIRKL